MSTFKWQETKEPGETLDERTRRDKHPERTKKWDTNAASFPLQPDQLRSQISPDNNTSRRPHGSHGPRGQEEGPRRPSLLPTHGPFAGNVVVLY